MITPLTGRCERCHDLVSGSAELCGRTIYQRWCDRCLELIEQEQAELKRMARVESARGRWAEVCPPEYDQTDCKKIPGQAAMKRVVGWQFGKRGLLIVGPTKKGKTRSAMVLLKRLAVDELKSVVLFLDNSFARQCAEMFGDGGSGWIKEAMKADVVLIDDLGKFKLTERVESELFGLIEHRTSWQRPIIVTMNATGQELESRMSADRGAPLLRRLREFCEPVAF